ncbi:MAG TPA: T9SS type A sorting domain-containing protein [Candidatus Kapabacteria bacterium]|nr:T9SS type A sorting domain-containing protein [Candidatus Kapabacteria bacterium]
MMKIASTVGGALAALLIATAAAPSMQAQAASVHEAGGNSALVKKMSSELGTLAANYWTQKLNDYKVRIDRALSSEDLAALNKLRVRWSMLLDQALAEMHAKHHSNSGVEGDGSSVAMEVSDPEQKLQEVMGIFEAAKEIAGRYEPQLSPLKGNVTDDASTFITTVADRAERFAADNRDVLAKDAQASDMMPARKDLDNLAASFKSGKDQRDFMMVYDMAIQPIILLYDGADLAALLNQAGSLSKPIAGIEMPDVSALRQNFPNPASATTTIAFKLPEGGGGASVLRLFNAAGELVGTYDQGSLSAGDHSADIDVSKLPSGSYLYHLTVQTTSGARVYSKTMQVVH